MNLVREYFETPIAKKGAKLRLNTQEMANLLGVTQGFVSTMTTGRRALPDAKKLLFYREAIKVLPARPRARIIKDLNSIIEQCEGILNERS